MNNWKSGHEKLAELYAEDFLRVRGDMCFSSILFFFGEGVDLDSHAETVGGTVDGRNPDPVYPIIYIPGGAGFFPSTVPSFHHFLV